MLKNIDPLLCGDLLQILDNMGHGDQLLLVDRNYPAYSYVGVMTMELHALARLP